jgi:hypothetical protein
MVSNNTLGEFTDQSESHDGPELKLYTAGDDTGAWAYVVTEKQTNVNPDTDTDADTDSDLPERRRDEITQEPQSGFVPQIHSVTKGLEYVDDTYPDAVVSTLTHQEAIVDLVEGSSDPSDAYYDRYRTANKIYLEHQPAWDITHIPAVDENPARDLL